MKRRFITELPNELLGYILKHLCSVKDIFSVMLSNSAFYILFEKNSLNYSTCDNVKFQFGTTPKTPKHYISTLCFKKKILKNNFIKTYPLLKEIIISGNKLVKDEHFKHFQGIHTLRMKGCSQYTISDKAFNYLNETKKLDMSYCNQLTITDNAFKPLKNIEFLDITCCHQETITTKLFSYIKNVKDLTINGCYQSNLKSEGLKHLDRLEELYISESFDDNDIIEGFGKNLKFLVILLTNFNYKSFFGLNKLQILCINQTTAILNDNMFKDLISLKSLTINGICSITDKYFIHLPKLIYLSMEDCNQNEITTKAFSYLPNLITLVMIGCNQITITKDVFYHLKKLQVLHLSTGNPKLFDLICFKKLKDLEEVFIKNLDNIKFDKDLLEFFHTLRSFKVSQ